MSTRDKRRHQHLRHFPPPLLDDLVSNRWLPVVGAGLSRNAKTPTGTRMPLWDDLGRALARELPDYSYSTVLDAISAYAHEHGRAKLVERLAGLLMIDSAAPGDVHRAFCSIPFDLVCTTNFDLLVEQQYAATPRYCRPILDEDQLAIPTAPSGVTLLKLHGDIHHPKRMIVTEDDYDGFLIRYPLLATYLANLLIGRTPVFLGYSLDDPDFRQVLAIVTERLGSLRRPAYRITVGATATEASRFARRGVKLINLPGNANDPAPVLAAALSELGAFFRGGVLSVSEVNEEQPKQRLTLPEDSPSALCFVSAPSPVYSQYRSIVFPLIRDSGFAPVSPEDVLSPGDNIQAKTEALLERAGAVIIDVGPTVSASELGWITYSTRARKPTVVITRDGAVAPPIADVTVIDRNTDVFTEDDDFVRRIADWIAFTGRPLRAQLATEPQKLLQARAYRAAVVAAITLLEVTLRDRLGKDMEMSRPSSIHTLVRTAVQRGILREDDWNRIREWSDLRNLAVHTDRQIPPQAARTVVEAVLGIVTRLQHA